MAGIFRRATEVVTFKYEYVGLQIANLERHLRTTIVAEFLHTNFPSGHLIAIYELSDIKVIAPLEFNREFMVTVGIDGKFVQTDVLGAFVEFTEDNLADLCGCVTVATDADSKKIDVGSVYVVVQVQCKVVTVYLKLKNLANRLNFFTFYFKEDVKMPTAHKCRAVGCVKADTVFKAGEYLNLGGPHHFSILTGQQMKDTSDQLQIIVADQNLLDLLIQSAFA